MDDNKLTLGETTFELKPLNFATLKRIQGSLGAVLEAVKNPTAALTSPGMFDGVRDIVHAAITQSGSADITKEALEALLTMENMGAAIERVFQVSGVKVPPPGEVKPAAP